MWLAEEMDSTLLQWAAGPLLGNLHLNLHTFIIKQLYHRNLYHDTMHLHSTAMQWHNNQIQWLWLSGNYSINVASVVLLTDRMGPQGEDLHFVELYQGNKIKTSDYACKSLECICVCKKCVKSWFRYIEQTPCCVNDIVSLGL